jgi:hypothetical protein
VSHVSVSSSDDFADVRHNHSIIHATLTNASAEKSSTTYTSPCCWHCQYF